MRLTHRSSLRVLVALALAPALGGGTVDSPAATAETAPGTLRVMSFNVRLSAADDGENAWPRRAGFFFKTITDFGPDLIGFQEVLADQHDALSAHLPDYAFSGVARDDGRRKGEWALIGFRKDSFQAIDHGDFWLSEQPAVAGSKSWDAALPRLCSWVRLRATATGREFVFANTHFDHRGMIARREASKVLLRELARIAAGAPAILTGDLNATEDDPPYAILTHSTLLAWIDAYREAHPTRRADELSFHAFKGGTAGSRIDYIFHTPHFTAVAAAIDRSAAADGHYPSDHYPVTAILQVKSSPSSRTP